MADLSNIENVSKMSVTKGSSPIC